MSNDSFSVGDGIGCAAALLVGAFLIFLLVTTLVEQGERDLEFKSACTVAGGQALTRTDLGYLCIRDGRIIEVTP